MRNVIRETFKTLALPCLFLALWFVLILFMIFGLQAIVAEYMPFVKEYFGILAMVVLIVPLVIGFVYIKRRQRRAYKNW